MLLNTDMQLCDNPLPKVKEIKSNFILPESLNTGLEQQKTNWTPMSAAPEAKLLNNTGKYLSLSQK